jgi:hypothetical protein
MPRAARTSRSSPLSDMNQRVISETPANCISASMSGAPRTDSSVKLPRVGVVS